MENAAGMMIRETTIPAANKCVFCFVLFICWLSIITSLYFSRLLRTKKFLSFIFFFFFEIAENKEVSQCRLHCVAWVTG
jgi:hypothetical protein